MINNLVAILLLSPLIGFLIKGWRWSCPHARLSGFIGGGACLLSFLSSMGILFILLNNVAPFVLVSFFSWVAVGAFNVSVSFLIDPLSVFMALIISGVGFLIHVFSVYYMFGDSNPSRYFAYLNLFIFNMMVLVLADNLLLMFVGWEGVGLCSYLLIGFWFKDAGKALAGMQAFIVNRIGDAGLLLGMLFLFLQIHSLQFHEIYSVIESSGAKDWIPWVCLCFVIGAVGKSAQIPLYVWLPPAMAGPTPVSALIHAATMVTAGVYLICRLGFLFSLAPAVLTMIGWIGGITAFFAGVVACAQTDIKKVLAYSTVSQLGYMFAALGVGAFTSALFHLMTHAFFKALLFLAAGAVIHSLHGEQNIFRMGGLRRYFPWLWIYFLIGFLSLIGLPPFAGFFSKDEILWKVFSADHGLLFSLVFLAALLTAFYMTRLFILVFYGEPSDEIKNKKFHSLNFFAKMPLLLLFIMAILGVGLGIPHVLSQYLPGHPPHILQDFFKHSMPVSKAIAAYDNAEGIHALERVELGLMAATAFFVLLVTVLTSWFYLKRQKYLKDLKNKYRNTIHTMEKAFFIDHFYYSKIVRPAWHLSRELQQSVDIRLIQGGIFAIQKNIIFLRDMFLSWQNGKLQSYILFMLLGLIVFILSVLVQ